VIHVPCVRLIDSEAKECGCQFQLECKVYSSCVVWRAATARIVKMWLIEERGVVL
jgi:hypothetical protein